MSGYPIPFLILKNLESKKIKIRFTYHTVEEVKQDYQFVMAKAPGRYDREEKWRINEITLVEKVPH
ncbi:hypothetical protein [Cytobacillus pseudoceanisediminis]|uniref:hypothetical protein n=1 Tax=Cytobacillus pseudoceanisediminis TaxID=3051614 RepID=UPI002161A2BC|nr:hypothetical protein [Cytobacillus firmus]